MQSNPGDKIFYTLATLKLADPQFAETIIKALEKNENEIQPQQLTFLVKEIIWGLTQEISFGKAYALGMAELTGKIPDTQLTKYVKLVHTALKQGPTLAQMIARYLVPLFCCDPDLLIKPFIKTIIIMFRKGNYTLSGPLGILALFLKENDTSSALSFINLLETVFKQELTYNRSRYLANLFSRELRYFKPAKRAWQIAALEKVVKEDLDLADPFINGLEHGLKRLGQTALNQFIVIGLEKYRTSPKLGLKFLSLASKLGQDTCRDMQVTVSLSQVKQQMDNYLGARIGKLITVHPLSFLPAALTKSLNGQCLALSDSNHIYLSNEIDNYNSKSENIRLYMGLMKMEACLLEFGTYDFDYEKAFYEREGCLGKILKNRCSLENSDLETISDLERFFKIFPDQDLAQDLFTIFEHGRIWKLIGLNYPGMLKKILPLYQQEIRRLLKDSKGNNLLLPLYQALCMDSSSKGSSKDIFKLDACMQDACDLFFDQIAQNNMVETIALLVGQNYFPIEAFFKTKIKQKQPADRYYPHYSLKIPFGHYLRPDIFRLSILKSEKLANIIKNQLVKKGIKVFKSDLQKKIKNSNNQLSADELQEIIANDPRNFKADHDGSFAGFIDFDHLDLSDIDGLLQDEPQISDKSQNTGFRYKEWDSKLGDYLHDHVLVREKLLPGIPGDFYNMTLEKRYGLISKIKNAFELLKPQGLQIMRPWEEGDEFDYAALLDFAVEKKAGLMPSDRLFIKRVKQYRDVAALLLVDFSRSTANFVDGSRSTVLDVAREAIVLLLEAVKILGDTFAVAGFSGTGRLGVDYFIIKDFYDNQEELIKSRINSVTPQRSTRMGAAIRHSAAKLEKIPAKTRLLIIISDGFPNDTGYKGAYAMEDTRRAIVEARAKSIYTKAVTVNIANSAKLDDIYGNVHHNTINSVDQLPDRMLDFYGAITR